MFVAGRCSSVGTVAMLWDGVVEINVFVTDGGIENSIRTSSRPAQRLVQLPIR
jgi:hypothetical protein